MDQCLDVPVSLDLRSQLCGSHFQTLQKLSPLVTFPAAELHLWYIQGLACTHEQFPPDGVSACESSHFPVCGRRCLLLGLDLELSHIPRR